MKNVKKILFLLFGMALLSCSEDDNPVTEEPFTATPYNLEVPNKFPEPFIPEDNPMTVEGIALGRHLFYEKKLSRDNSMSCGTCHLQQRAFTDATPTSTGVRGQNGRRKAMALFNLAWQQNFFWDGRVSTLEEQALHPILDPLEFDNTLDEVVRRLEQDTMYQRMFKDAFGTEEVNPDRIGKAIAQFERTMVSANSKFDRVVRLNTGEQFTPAEQRGFELFTNEEGDCFHCHGHRETGYLMGSFGKDLQFANNGTKSDYSNDEGLAEVTGSALDVGKFKIPSVRNAELSFPYMHDGGIPTLDSLVGFYNFGGHNHPNVDPNMKAAGEGRQWTAGQRKDLEAFIRTLTDFEFLRDSAFSDPFRD